MTRGMARTRAARAQPFQHRRRESVDRLSARACPESDFTADNGLNFNVLCGKDFPDFDLLQTTAIDVDDCMTKCAHFTTDQCIMAVFEPSSGSCWLKNNDIDTDPSTADDMSDRQVGIANSDQFESLNTECPFNNNTLHSTPHGPEYKVECGMDLPQFDTACDGCPWHADTLQDCMNLCQTAHPLCAAVSWNPDMQGGFANCYPKSSFERDAVALSPYVTHLAIAQLPASHPDQCQDESIRTSSNNKKYQLSCNTDRPGSSADLVAVHDMNFTSCLERCANYTSDDGTACQGIVHDPDMVAGYQNCYLKGSIVEAVKSDGFTAAFLKSLNLGATNPTKTAKLPSPTSTATRSSTPGSLAPDSKHQTSTPAPVSTDSGSDAWIAGVVVGILAFFAILAGGFWYWRRRQKQRAHQFTPGPAAMGDMGAPMGGSSPPIGYHAPRSHVPILTTQPPSTEKYDHTYFQPPGFGDAGYTYVQPPPSAGPLSGNNLYAPPPFGDTKLPSTSPPHPTELSAATPPYPTAATMPPTELSAANPVIVQELDGIPRSK